MNTIILRIFAYAAPGWITNLSFTIIQPLEKAFPWFKKINKPIDGGRNFFDGKRIFGDSVTFIGTLWLIIVALFIFSFFAQPFWLILLKTGCAWAGDALGAFIKRRCNYKRGEFMPFVDHADYMIFTGIVFFIAGLEKPSIIILALIITYIFHPLFCIVGYYLKVKAQPY